MAGLLCSCFVVCLFLLSLRKIFDSGCSPSGTVTCSNSTYLLLPTITMTVTLSTTRENTYYMESVLLLKLSFLDLF